MAQNQSESKCTNIFWILFNSFDWLLVASVNSFEKENSFDERPCWVAARMCSFVSTFIKTNEDASIHSGDRWSIFHKSIGKPFQVIFINSNWRSHIYLHTHTHTPTHNQRRFLLVMHLFCAEASGVHMYKNSPLQHLGRLECIKIVCAECRHLL